MNRRDFFRLASVLGLTPICRSVASSEVRYYDDFGKVLIVGAGPAGMSVAHLLEQAGLDYLLFEAAKHPGGRTKTNMDFVDFPIPLGAEWLHAEAETLEEIVNDDGVEVDVERLRYAPESTYGLYERGEIKTWSSGDVSDLKFKDHTWLTFFKQYILPGIQHKIQLETQIVSIDHSFDGVMIKDANGKSYTGQAVVMAVPPMAIKERRISFVPDLPTRKRDAFDKAIIWTGFKAFFTFKKRFYPTFLDIDGANTRKGQKMFYDAAYGQDTEYNVLGLFSVGDQAEPYQGLRDSELKDKVLTELDQMFDGQASAGYLSHISQDWSQEPFIHQAYFANSGNWRLPPRMRSAINQKVFFAGDTYTNGEDWGSVHAAAESAREAVDMILKLHS